MRPIFRFVGRISWQFFGDPVPLPRLVSLTALLVFIGSAFAIDPTQRPNIVLMMADDMGMGDTSVYQDFTGNSDDQQLHTPNMQRLANLGVRFTDAHTPSSRCTPTRYALLTGRYPWRNRLKHWVLFGVQGDPMIEADRPTIGTLLQQHDYRTGMFGKWHIGLRYRTSSGGPADAWNDADLTQPMYDTPLDHGFDVAKFTSRSHGTSGPTKDGSKKNGPKQSGGPGHVDGRTVVGATGNGKEIVNGGPHAYVLSELGRCHLGNAITFMEEHVRDSATAQRPFFVYYPSNSNHAPYTPDSEIDSIPVSGQAKNIAGKPMNARSDFIYENDVALGRLLDFLINTDDPRRPGRPLMENTIVIFTSDNGAEIQDKFATGPFRSHKGSVYEGGHRVPFLVAWPAGGVGDGDPATPGKSSEALICLQDMYATVADVLGAELPDPAKGQKGAEDSVSVLAAWRGGKLAPRPVFFNDHLEAKDHAAAAMRIDDPKIDGSVVPGKWKLFFDDKLLREGIAEPVELFNLDNDPQEQNDLMQVRELRSMTRSLQELALVHRTTGGHRLVPYASTARVTLAWGDEPIEDPQSVVNVRSEFLQTDQAAVSLATTDALGVEVRIEVTAMAGHRKADGFSINQRGLGVKGGQFDQVDDSEALVFRFDRDVVVESVSIIAGNGMCGGFYRVGDQAPQAIYCIDADIDAQDQSGILSDIGVVRAGELLRLDSRPHLDVESPGQWRIRDLTFRTLQSERRATKP